MSMLSRFAATGGGVATDPYWNSVSLLLVGNGANGTTTNIVDSSNNHYNMTPAGNTQISTAKSKYGSGSVYFDGSGDYIGSSNWGPSANFGTSNFTIEMWLHATAAPNSNQIIFSAYAYPSSNGVGLYYTGGSSTQIAIVSGSGVVASASGGWGFNNWIHVAIVRSGGTVTLYLGGVNRGSATFTNNCTDGLQYIGRPSDTPLFSYNGYIYDFRITKGVARYTSDFTPPTAPFPTS